MKTNVLISNSSLKKVKIKKVIFIAINYFILILFAALVIIPFWYLIVSSFKTGQEVSIVPVKWLPWISFEPINPIFENFKLAFTQSFPSLTKGFLNTLKIAVPTVVFCITTSTFASYGFAKLNLKFGNFLFTILLFNMMIPGVVVLIPQFMIFQFIGWDNTILPLVVPISFGSINCIFFLKQSMSGVPNELIESARLDGLSEPMIVLKIVAPLIKSAIITQVIFVFLATYNDYMGPLIYLDSSQFTIQLSIESLQATSGNTQVVMAGALIALIPTIILFFSMQRFYISGIAVTGIKG